MLLCLVSGGWLWWRSVRLVLAVARRAPCYAEGQVLLVPGYRLHGDEVPYPYALRLRRAVRLWRPGRRLVLSGAAAGPGQPSEALAGYVGLRDLGLPAAAPVDLDEAARDTLGNLAAARERSRRGETAVVISNRWHLARCALLARQIGLDVKLCAAERRWRANAFAGLALCREAFAILCCCGAEAARIPPHRLLETLR